MLPTTTEPELLLLGRETFPKVPGARGSLVFADAGTACSVREVALPGGDELPNVVGSSSCELWAAPGTTNVAVGVGQGSRDSVPFRFVDLARSSRNLGGSRAFFGFLIWSPDGRRAAWCTRASTGFDLELGGPSRRLPRCPSAYTQEGEIAYAIGRRLVIEDRTALRASGGITFVNFAPDGSTAIVIEGRRIERYSGGRLRGEVDLFGELEGRTPIFSPDNCAALFRVEDGIRLVNIGCSGWRNGSYAGTAAAWSPDGSWVAVAERGTIAFYFLPGGRDVVRWPVGAVQLAWRG